LGDRPDDDLIRPGPLHGSLLRASHVPGEPERRNASKGPKFDVTNSEDYVSNERRTLVRSAREAQIPTVACGPSEPQGEGE
jgi:hypothetical protein